MCPLGRRRWPCTPDRNSRRPSALRRGVEFRQNATSTLGRRPHLRLDAMECEAASFYSTCLIRAELRNAEGSKNLQYNGSTIGGRQELKFPRIVAPLRKFGRPNTAAHKAGVDVLGGLWAVSGEWPRHRFQTLFTTAPGFRLHEKRAPRREEKSSRFPRTFASHKVAHRQPSAQLLELYVVYLINPEGANGSLKNIDLYDQKTAPLTPNSFIYNRYPFSRVGRQRGQSSED
jgi:hypothetical protein